MSRFKRPQPRSAAEKSLSVSEVNLKVPKGKSAIKNIMKICCFTGSRPESFPWGDNESDPRCGELKSKIETAVRELMDDGFARFISGMARGADIICAETVLALSEEYEGIELECAVPCPEQARGWSEEWTSRRDAILAKASKVTTLCPHYTNFCMSKRNAYMVDNSDFVIAVWGGQPRGGTFNTIRKAESAGKPIKIIRY